MIEAKYEVFEEKDGDPFGKKLGEQHNRIVYDGIEMMLDFTFGIESWFSGAEGYDGSLPASGAWNPYRWIALGYSADDNNDWLEANGYALTGAAGGGDNMTGGTGIKADIVITGANISHFPSLSDTKMSSLDASTSKNIGTGLFYKLADRIKRTGRTVTIEATFTTNADRANGDNDTIPTGTQIREMGIFLGEPTGSGNPSSIRADRPSAMISKAVRYQISGGYIQDHPITVGANNLSVRYTVGSNL